MTQTRDLGSIRVISVRSSPSAIWRVDVTSRYMYNEVKGWTVVIHFSNSRAHNVIYYNQVRQRIDIKSRFSRSQINNPYFWLFKEFTTRFLREKNPGKIIVCLIQTCGNFYGYYRRWIQIFNCDLIGPFRSRVWMTKPPPRTEAATFCRSVLTTAGPGVEVS